MNVFITHSWQDNEKYQTFTSILNQFNYYNNISIPKTNPSQNNNDNYTISHNDVSIDTFNFMEIYNTDKVDNNKALNIFPEKDMDSIFLHKHLDTLIQQSSIIFFLATSKSMRSKWVKFELASAIKNRKPIFLFCFPPQNVKIPKVILNASKVVDFNEHSINNLLGTLINGG